MAVMSGAKVCQPWLGGARRHAYVLARRIDPLRRVAWNLESERCLR